jgi:hypothetical protein
MVVRVDGEARILGDKVARQIYVKTGNSAEGRDQTGRNGE